jgi:peptidyl-prolyl cis-trans isomerase B (cyclophilin B)
MGRPSISVVVFAAAVAAALVARSAAIAGRPASSGVTPSARLLGLTAGGPQSPQPTATPKAKTSPGPQPKASPSPSPSGNGVLTPPTPSIADSDVMGKIGELERAGAGPLPEFPTSKHRPQRLTAPSDLAAYLTNADPSVDARAAIALGRLRNPAGVSALVAQLQSRAASDDVKAAAAFSLGTIGSLDGESALVDALFHASPEVAAAAADSLGRIGGDSVIDPLVRALSSHDPTVRGNAAVGLGEATTTVNPPRIIDPAFRQSAGAGIASSIAYERDPEAKWRMAWAIGRSLYDIDQANLKTMLTDKEELVRIFAAQGMRRLDDPKNILPLHLAAQDDSWRVRVEVARALVTLRDTSTKVDLTPPDIPDSDSDQPDALDTSTPYGPNPEVAIVTSLGTIVVELFPDEAPYNVDNFLYLVDRGYYDNQELFRVIQDFVIQGGDPTNGSGDGGPGYTVPAELNPVQQLTGVIALGLDYPNNVPDVDSGGSQFYVTESPQLHLDENFSTFGRVVSGMPVVFNIRTHSADTAADRKLQADLVIKMYRCKPVLDQTPEIEHMLRTKEIGYDITQ